MAGRKWRRKRGKRRRPLRRRQGLGTWLPRFLFLLELDIALALQQRQAALAAIPLEFFMEYLGVKRGLAELFPGLTDVLCRQRVLHECCWRVLVHGIACCEPGGVTLAVRVSAEPSTLAAPENSTVIHHHFRRVPRRCSEDGDSHDRWFTTQYYARLLCIVP